MNDAPSTNETGLRALRSARELLADPKHWTQRATARAEDGRVTCSDGMDATSFCILGAILRGGNDCMPWPSRGSIYDAIYASIVRRHGDAYPNIPAWNDAPSRTHGEVLEVLDETISNLEEGAAP